MLNNSNFAKVKIIVDNQQVNIQWKLKLNQILEKTYALTKNATCSWVNFQNLKLMKQSVVIDTSGWSINLKMCIRGQSFYINK